MDIVIYQKGLVGLLTSFFLATPAFADNGQMYLGASIAASIARVADPAQISYYSGTSIIDSYPLVDNNPGAAVCSVNAGYEFSALNSIGHPVLALGLGLYRTLTEYDFSGQLIETANGNNPAALYDYQYELNNTRVMAEAQLTWRLASFSPFISVGVGSSWNKSQDYLETPITSNGYVPLPPFQEHSETQFAYQLGFGISTAGNLWNDAADVSHDRASLGYRFVNLNDTSFGTRGEAYPYQLRTGNLHSNEVYLSYTHLF